MTGSAIVMSVTAPCKGQESNPPTPYVSAWGWPAEQSAGGECCPYPAPTHLVLRRCGFLKRDPSRLQMAGSATLIGLALPCIQQQC